MSETTPDVATALLAAAAVLPSHFADTDELTVTPLSALQATTMSLPGGALAMQAELKDAGPSASAVLILTNMVDHSTGELMSRDDAKAAWTTAITEVVEALAAELGQGEIKKSYMTDPYDVLEAADEAEVVGVFKGDTLACMLLSLPTESTGEGAAAALAAQVAEAEAEAAPEEGEENADSADAEAATTDETAEAGDAAAEEPAPDADQAPVAEAPPTAPDPAAAAGAQLDQATLAAMAAAGMIPGMAPMGAEPTEEEKAARAAAQAAYAGAPAMTLPQLGGAVQGLVDPRRIDLLREVVMGVSVELGRTRLPVQDILSLSPGAIVELDRAAGAPVDVLVNGTLIARGEVVVVDEEFAVRISEVVTPEMQRQVSR